MLAVLVAQFLSAFADNALLIAAIALVKLLSSGEKLVPFLQESFVVPFLLLAPFVGPLADALPKGRVMMIGNGLKFAGASLMLAGGNPVLCYGLVGAGAAIYSPAKYGILSQLFGPDKLVKANGLLEASTIAAILLGVVAGGMLADRSVTLALGAITGCYIAAALVNLLIPRLAAEHPLDSWHPAPMLRGFGEGFASLLRDRDARFSLLGTSLFWGSGTTLRLMLFAWVPVALGMADNQTPANLMGVVSVGIVAGAMLAGFFISLANVNRALVGGLLLGPVILALGSVHSLPLAAGLLAAVGLCGGAFVVPLNALLQERGHTSIGAGRALAVQNFFENSFMLLFVGLYSATGSAGLPVTTALQAFGTLLLAGIASLGVRRWRSSGHK
jgi:LPLT family lysophospholipid transporter-like MFS transporter